MRTIGDLQKETEPMPAATRREIAAVLDQLADAFDLIYTALGSLNDFVDKARGVVARDDEGDAASIDPLPAKLISAP